MKHWVSIVSHEFHIGADLAAFFDGLPDGGQHGFGLLMEQILHLNGAHGSADLESGLPCHLQRIPGDLNGFRIQSHGDGNDAVLHGSGDGLDPQGVDLGLGDGLQLNDGNTQLVQQLAQLDLFPKRQGNLGACLLHGHIADSDLVHNSFSFSFSSGIKKSLRSC